MVFRLREILKDRHITLGQLSEISGISQSNLSNYMTGKVSPTLDTLCRIAEALSVDVTELFRKEEEFTLMVRFDGKTLEIGKDELIEFIRKKIQKDETRKNK